jgi:hypothetical protein
MAIRDYSIQIATTKCRRSSDEDATQKLIRVALIVFMIALALVLIAPLLFKSAAPGSVFSR